MSKYVSSVILDMSKISSKSRKRFWNQVLTDAVGRLKCLHQKTEEMEQAIEVFRRNAAEGAPVPGELSDKKTGTAEAIPANNP